MKFQIVSEKGVWDFEADKIFQSENAIIGQKESGENVAIVSKDNVIAVIIAE